MCYTSVLNSLLVNAYTDVTHNLIIFYDCVQGKLVKLFSLQLVTKRHLPVGVVLPSELQQYPSLKQWLQVVGLSKDSINVSCTEYICILIRTY